MCDHCKNESRLKYEFKNHRKNLHHQLGANVFTGWQVSHWNGIRHELQVHVWSLQNKSHSRNEFKNHKKRLHHQFGAQKCSLYDKCHIERNMTWTTSSFVITAKMKVAQEPSLRITGKTFIKIKSHKKGDPVNRRTNNSIEPVVCKLWIRIYNI